MGLRLHVHRAAWQRSIDRVATDMPGLIPVVKGNGYGFGRQVLMPIASRLAMHIAVGTVFEALDVPTDRTAVVLTPALGALPASLPNSAVLTVGHAAHVDDLRRNQWTGDVALKLRSTMHRFGVEPGEVGPIVAAIAASGANLAMYSLHLDLAGSDDEHLDEISTWLAHLDPTVPVSVSHLQADAFRRLRVAHPHRAFTIRLGTALWHADKSLLQLRADVVDLHPIEAGTRAGYRATVVPADGHLIVIAAGSAHGVQPLDDGRSPFHFARQRVTLLEPPHMHSSLAFVPTGQPCPLIGDEVDVQRPLITTNVDEIAWTDD